MVQQDRATPLITKPPPIGRKRLLIDAVLCEEVPLRLSLLLRLTLLPRLLPLRLLPEELEAKRLLQRRRRILSLLSLLGLGPGRSWLVLSCLVLPCLALPCLALPCLALPCLALPCLVKSCSDLACLALPCLVLSSLVL